MTVPRFIRWRRFQVWAVLSISLAVLLSQLPLFNVLGFEFSLAVAVFASVAGLDLGCAWARRELAARVADESGYQTNMIGPMLATATLSTTALLAPPLVGAMLSGIWTPTCDVGFGVQSFVLLPLCTTFLMTGGGVVIGLVVGPQRRVLGNALPYVVWLGMALLGLARFYNAPPVFSYNALIGYFPGNLYDEDVSLGAALWWSRLEQASVVAALLAACAATWDGNSGRFGLRRLRQATLRRRVRVFTTVIVPVLLATVLRANSGTLGYSIGASDVRDALGGRLETEHFTIIYAAIPSIEAELPLIAQDHEFRLSQVEHTLGVTVSGKITSYIFESADQKAQLLGARRVEMAKPWRREIYLEHREFPYRSLRHEIAHVVAAEFGDSIFGVSAKKVFGLPVVFNPGLIEGLAVAADWPGSYDQALTPHQAVRAMVEQGGEPSVADLLSMRFLSVSSVRGYTTAGSFLRFLLERDGQKKLRDLYRSGGDFKGVYGESLSELSTAWRNMINTVSLPPEATEGTRDRYRSTSVFQRPCPHAIAARQAQVIRYVEAQKLPQAIALQRRICDDAPDEPRNQFDLAALLSAGGADEQAEASTLWQGLAAADAGTTSSLRASALSNLAGVAIGKSDLAGARDYLQQALALQLDDTQRRQLAAKQTALSHEGPASKWLRGYFFDGEGRSGLELAAAAVAAEPDLALSSYLLGLQLANADQFARAATILSRALTLGLPSVLLKRFASRVLAVAAYRAGDLAGLQQAIAELADANGTQVDHLLAEDWQARLAFDASHRR